MSINAQSSQVLAVQLEQVRKQLAVFLVSEQSAFMKMFNKAAEKHRISSFADSGGSVLAWRIPVLLSKGGDYQGITLDGGDLGTGSMMNTAFMAVGAFENDLAINVPYRSIISTKSEQQAMTNTWAYQIASGIQEMALYNEIGFFQDSTGILATSLSTTSSPGTTAVYVLDNVNAWDRLRGSGARVDIYDTGGTCRATGGRISSINFATNTVTVTGNSSFTPTAGDTLNFPVAGATVATTTDVAGSWRNGLYTFSTTNTSGSLLGLPYSAAYELACSVVNCQSGPYGPSQVFAGKTQLIQRRDDKAYSGVVGVCHMAQRVSWYEQGLTIANNFVRNGEGVKSTDMAGQGTKYGDTFTAGDVVHHVSRYATKTRVDWVIPSNFGWVETTPIDFFTNMEGGKTFVGRSSTTGNPQAGFQAYILNTQQLYCCDPGSCVNFYNAAVPALQ